MSTKLRGSFTSVELSAFAEKFRPYWERFMATPVGRQIEDFMETQRPKPLYPSGPTAPQLLAETAKQRRVPGIIFANGPTGRRARIAGTGIEVFEVISTFRAVGGDRVKLAERYDWLTPAQLDAALAYAVAFPEEIDSRLRAAEALESSYRNASIAR